MFRHRTLFIAAAVFAAFGATACSEEDREEIGNEVEEGAENVEDAARTAASEVEEAAGEAAADVAEVAVRNLATQQGEEQFTDSGNPLDEDSLSCDATVADGLDTIDVNCTGTTEDGGTAELTVSTSELPGASVTEIEGMFTGTVDGTEVFTSTNLGG